MEDGGPAFPSEQTETHDRGWNQTLERGMSLRDWFAGMALCGKMIECKQTSLLARRYTAKEAYEFADAMLAESEKED